MANVRALVPLIVLLWLFQGSSANAAPLAVEDVPEPLRPWIRWVLHDLPQARCPYLQGSTSERRCQWPSRLTLTIGDKEGAFTQRWQVHERGWAPLPGDGERWPQSVEIDGAPAVVIARGGVPGVVLEEGVHELRGAFLWDSMPEQLRIPPETGLLELEVEGKRIAAPQREASGVLWLHRRAEEGTEANRLDLQVHRRIVDGIPITVTTQVELQVSGKNREVLLGAALLTGFQPLAVESELPVRLEPDGRLRVQVRPGRWDIRVDAHYDKAITALPLGASEGPWADEEVWVFEAHPELRRIEIGEVIAVDPQQTRLPEDWKSLPAYRVRPGETMLMIETHRGEVDRGPDRLDLEREWWLDYDGRGLTVRDHLTGEVYQGSRLTMNPPAALGRVSGGGKDQFITHLGDPQAPGIELRQRSLDLWAESRVPMAQILSAVDWEHDFHRVGGTLHLPPGWRLLHVAGVDDVDDSWLGRWDLLEIFLVLVITIGIARLYGVLWGFVALCTLALAFPEWMAPRTIWLFVLAGEGLLRVLPEGKLRRVVSFYRVATLVILAAIVVTFAVQQVRQGLYPALEKRYRDNIGGLFFLGMAREAPEMMVQAAPASMPTAKDAANYDDIAQAEDFKAVPMEEIEAEYAPDDDEAGGGGQRHKGEEGVMGKRGSITKKPQDGGDYAQSSIEWAAQRKQAKRRLQEYDASTVIQTGPGVPAWRWGAARLSWSGPVDKGQQIRLFLLPPALGLGLAFARVLLMTLLCLAVFGLVGRRRRAAPSPGGGAKAAAGAVAILLAFGTAWFAPARAGAEVPRAEVLDQLRERLVEAPTCLPECAVVPRLQITVNGEAMRMVMEIHAASDIAAPLPGSTAQWLPTTVLVDDLGPAAAGRGLARSADGVLWIDLPAGRHQVIVEGPLPARETVQVSFPLKPRRVEASATGWTIDGIHEDGIADPDLQLTRIHSEDKAAETLEMGPLPPFVQVERELNLGLNWEVTTRVVRRTPPGSAVVLAVPILPGESVTTANFRVEDGKVQVNMAPDVSSVEWTSALEIQPELALTAAESQPWVEVWRLEVGPVWHIESAGIPVIRQGDGGLREWRPWPGEAVTIAVTRPEGAQGQTLTLDRARLELRPGLRATDATLSVDIRSSRGGQHDLTLPPGAQLQSVSLNGVDQTIGQSGDQVRVPVVPGSQTAVLSWREPELLTPRYDGPIVGLGGPAVNVEVTVEFPRDRWILWVMGPRMGPAVLFWSYIFMLLIASLILGSVRWTPLRHHQWFLLGVGLSPLPVPAAMIVVGWLLVLGWRRRTPELTSGWFNLRQLVIAGWTLAAIAALIGAITAGLLGQPDMQIEGNGSWDHHLSWFQDRSTGAIARPTIFSVSMWWYRGLMLAWALWLAWSLIRWLPWSWQSFAAGGYWKKMIPDHWMHPNLHRGAAPGMGGPAAPGAPLGGWQVPAEAPRGDGVGWSGPAQPQVGVRPAAPAAAPGATTQGMPGPGAEAPASAPAAAPASAQAAAPRGEAARPDAFSAPWRRPGGLPPPPPKGTVIPNRLSTRAGDSDPGEGEDEG